MKNLYNKIVEVIKGAENQFTQKNLPVPATVTLYQGQPESPLLFRFTTPAIFIDYQVGWETGSKEKKTGIVTTYIHVLMDHPTTSTTRWTDPQRKMEYYELLLSILEGVKTEETGGLTLFIEETVQGNPGVYPVFHFIAPIYRELRSPFTKAEASPNISIDKLR